MKNIIIKGAREHNLKNITVQLPRDKFIVIQVSQVLENPPGFSHYLCRRKRRYVQSLQLCASVSWPHEQLHVDSIEGLSPAISIEQKTTSKNPRSTVGTVTEIYDYMRLLFARVGILTVRFTIS